MKSNQIKPDHTYAGRYGLTMRVDRVDADSVVAIDALGRRHTLCRRTFADWAISDVDDPVVSPTGIRPTVKHDLPK